MREPLRVRVAEKDEQCQGRQSQGQGVESRGGEDENQTAGHDEEPDERGSDMAGWKGPVRRSGIGRVDRAIHQAVEAHGGAAGPDHSDDDPSDDAPLRPALGCQQHAQKSERQGKQSVLEFDHFEHGAEALETAHDG